MRDEWERVAAPITASHYCLATPLPPPLSPPTPLLGCVADRILNANVFLFMDLITVCLQYLHACQVEWAGEGPRACAREYVEWKKKEKKSERSNNYVYVRQWKNPGVVMISNYKILFSGISRVHCASRQVQFARL